MKSHFKRVALEAKALIDAKWLPYWKGLTEREQKLMWGLLGAMALFLPYLIHLPLSHAITEQTRALHEKKATLAWMQASNKTWQSAPDADKPKQLGVTEALSVISHALDASSMHAFAYELTQLEGNTLQLSFEKVPYQPFLDWLFKMESKYNFNIQSLRAEKTETTGLSRLQVVFGFDAS